MRGRRGRVALAIGVLAAWLPASAMGVSREPGLRTDISIAALSEELERAIPQLMAEARVPGLAVAVVRGGEIAWTRGFGFADRFTPVPVRADTIFQVASNGKAVAGYAATRLVEQGALELDRALHDYLEVPFLPEGPHRSGITLRRVLSHSAGLSNRVDGEGDRRSRFPPGERFATPVWGTAT
ncbi:MAG: serine hydrolase [Proteobacteria bacterium]|nr:serine hydrolase [Pseudomonadota bacterium]